MKRCFRVFLHMADGSTNDYNIIATDDLEAREKAAKMDARMWKEFSSDHKAPSIDYCETKEICCIDE